MVEAVEFADSLGMVDVGAVDKVVDTLVDMVALMASSLYRCVK